MAVDLALLDRAELGEGWFRLYTWNPYCLSLGRHEPASRRYDVDRIQALGLSTVRRPTGGRAVWHAHELTYAVAEPHRWFGSLREAYEAIHTLLAGALRSLGVPAALAPRGRTAALDSGPCFAHPAGGEVLVGQRKIIGSAQLRQGPALLQHGSIILEDDQHLVEDLLLQPDRRYRPSAPARGHRSHGRRSGAEPLARRLGCGTRLLTGPPRCGLPLRALSILRVDLEPIVPLDSAKPPRRICSLETP